MITSTIIALNFDFKISLSKTGVQNSEIIFKIMILNNISWSQIKFTKFILMYKKYYVKKLNFNFYFIFFTYLHYIPLAAISQSLPPTPIPFPFFSESVSHPV